MSSEQLHEDPQKLSDNVVDVHRAIVSIMEELEAVDWYNQRSQATTHPELRAILEHNRDEEKEHAAMVMEWLRRNDAKFAQHCKTFLFTEGPVTEIEAEMEDGGGAAGKPMATGDGSLGIGSLRKVGT